MSTTAGPAPTPGRALRVGGLFAGYGGLEMGLAQVARTRPVWWSENEAAPSWILAERFPRVPNLGDITKIDWRDVEPVDVITGGFPCQDVSHAGKRAGLRASTRTGLWVRMLDAVDVLRGGHRLSPRFVEFLMGLPDGWVTDVPGVTRNHALKALGNGVVPQQAAAAIRHLLTLRSLP